MKKLLYIGVAAALMLPARAMAQDSLATDSTATSASAASATTSAPAASPARAARTPAPLTKAEIKAMEKAEKERKKAEEAARKQAEKDAKQRAAEQKKKPLYVRDMEADIVVLKASQDSLRRLLRAAQREANSAREQAQSSQEAAQKAAEQAAQAAQMAQAAQQAAQQQTAITYAAPAPSSGTTKGAKGRASELSYKVQLLAQDKKIDNVKAAFELFDINDPISEDVVVGVNETFTYKYLVGPYTTIERARQECFRIRNNGKRFKDAFVVPYFQGKRITMGEAREIMGTK